MTRIIDRILTYLCLAVGAAVLIWGINAGINMHRDLSALESGLSELDARIADTQQDQAEIWARIEAMPARAAPEEVVPEVVPQAAPESELEYIDEFRITVYTPYCDGGVWGYRTATGVRSEHLATCAVDPDVIPLGSIIKVGELELIAVDVGSAVKGAVVDVFYDGPVSEAYVWVESFGTTHDVYIETEVPHATE